MQSEICEGLTLRETGTRSPFTQHTGDKWWEAASLAVVKGTQSREIQICYRGIGSFKWSHREIEAVLAIDCIPLWDVQELQSTQVWYIPW